MGSYIEGVLAIGVKSDDKFDDLESLLDLTEVIGTDKLEHLGAEFDESFEDTYFAIRIFQNGFIDESMIAQEVLRVKKIFKEKTGFDGKLINTFYRY